VLVAIPLDLLAIGAFSLIVVHGIFRIGVGMECGNKRHWMTSILEVNLVKNKDTPRLSHVAWMADA